MSDAGPLWDLMLQFDRDDPQFASGFALGMLYQRLQETAEQIVRDVPIRVTDKEMVERIAKTTGFNIIIDEDTTDPKPYWAWASFFRAVPEAAA